MVMILATCITNHADRRFCCSCWRAGVKLNLATRSQPLWINFANTLHYFFVLTLTNSILLPILIQNCIKLVFWNLTLLANTWRVP